MAKRNPHVRRIFGGASAEPTDSDAKYTRPLYNEGTQAQAETLAVGTTRRVFKGPSTHNNVWSYHINNLTVSGATSAIKFYGSNLPQPDPTDAAHWDDLAVTAIDLAAVAVYKATRTDLYEWIKAEAVTVTTAGTLWGYVKVNNVEDTM